MSIASKLCVCGVCGGVCVWGVCACVHVNINHVIYTNFCLDCADLGAMCYDGRCYPNSGKCNDLAECLEGEDELNCRKYMFPWSALRWHQCYFFKLIFVLND